MSRKHRKTLIREEGWPLIDGWYWCPKELINKRVDFQKMKFGSIRQSHPLWFSFFIWKSTQFLLSSRLAHACADGKISAPVGVETYERKRGGWSIYGKCKKCGSPLSEGVKTIIFMEYFL